MSTEPDPLTSLARLSGRYLQTLGRARTKPGYPRSWHCALVPDDGRLDMGTWSVGRGDEIFGKGATPEEAIRAALAQVPEVPSDGS